MNGLSDTAYNNTFASGQPIGGRKIVSCAASVFKTKGSTTLVFQITQLADFMSIKKSVVIPTLWRCPDRLARMLEIYERSRYIKEVIIIDNDPGQRPNLAYSKVRMLTRGKNLYVNPAWNWGAAEAKYELILANDDIELERIDELIECVDAKKFEIVGACNGLEDSNIEIDAVDDIPWVSPYDNNWSCGYGAMMFVRNYTPVPESMKIYYGDNILFDRARSKGMFHGLKFINPSVTAERSSEWDSVKRQDEKQFIEYLDTQGQGLSVAMIVRNECDHVEACLETIKDADEIVIVDTGSRDETIEICKRYTKKVYYGKAYTWRDDFAYSRNQALGKCRAGNWILSIDADERLELGGIHKLRRLIASTNCYGYEICLEAEGTGHIHYSTRFFRKLPGVTWNEPIHEVASVRNVERCDVSIIYGRSNAHDRDPGRAMRILRKAVEEQPENSRRRYYLAREYWYAGEFEKAYYHFDYYTKIGTWPPELADGLLMKARCMWQLGRGHEARGVCLEAIRMNPNFKEALLFMSEMHYEPWKSRWASFSELADNSGVLFVRV